MVVTLAWPSCFDISEGLSYNKADGVKIEIFTDKDCTDKVASWDMNSGKFAVSYSNDDRHMTVDVSKAGLDEINGRTANVNGHVYQLEKGIAKLAGILGRSNKNTTRIYIISSGTEHRKRMEAMQLIILRAVLLDSINKIGIMLQTNKPLSPLTISGVRRCAQNQASINEVVYSVV